MSAKIIELKHHWGKTEFEALLRNKLASASRGLHLRMPSVGLEKASKLMTFPPERRHKLEETFIDRVLKESLNLAPSDPTPYDPEWLPTGQPRFGGTPAPSLGLSLAHDESFCLCVVGSGAQGCDLETERPVSQDEWTTLLSMAEPAFRQAVMDDQSVELSAARLRASVSAAWKALRADKIRLRFAGRFEESVLVTASGGGREVSILTQPIATDDRLTRVIAVLVEVAALARHSQPASSRAEESIPEPSSA